MLNVSVVVPYHPARATNGLLDRAVASVHAQTMPHQLITVCDDSREGAGPTRQRGLEQVTSPWVAFLDSDDEMDPNHLERLLAFAAATGADYVYPWFRVVGGTDPFPFFFGKPWDDSAPHSTTITILVRTELAQQITFENREGEDHWFTLQCVEAGAKIVHLPERTWTWHHHRFNSSGRPGRGDAV